MNQRIRDLTTRFRLGVEAIYQTRLKGVFLFGSHARGEASTESDVDRTSVPGAELSPAYAVSISEVFVSERDWLMGHTPFLQNVRREALRV